jgi:hypothetical protein
MKDFDGMEGIVEIKSKKTLCVSTKYPTFRNLFGYRQIGVYAGNAVGIEETDKVRIYFKHPKNWKEKIKIMWTKINIERVELVSPGLRPKRLQYLKYVFLGK